MAAVATSKSDTLSQNIGGASYKQPGESSWFDYLLREGSPFFHPQSINHILPDIKEVWMCQTITTKNQILTMIDSYTPMTEDKNYLKDAIKMCNIFTM